MIRNNSKKDTSCCSGPIRNDDEVIVMLQHRLRWRNGGGDLTLVVVVILLVVASRCHGACDQMDRDSLLSLSQAFNFVNWSSSSGAGDDCCTWEGVVCNDNNNTNDDDARVTRLTLPFRQLQGHIPASIVNLSYLTHLNLSHNRLSGTLPSLFFASLNQLETIDLSSNRLSGQLSGSLPHNLQTLDLSSNHFSGTIQSSLFTTAPSLTSFNVSNNSFTGPLPPAICTNTSLLRRLDFSFNNFVGQIPYQSGHCLKLEVLRAGFSNLSGSLPTVIYTSTALQEIFLSGNHLYGPIDEAITKLSNLTILSLYGNNLNGSIPLQIGNLSRLEQLLLYINNLSGTLPPSLVNCTSLRILNLRVNSFGGELSALNFSNLLQLNTIDLGNNFFTGQLPLSLFSCKSLTAIRLATNQLRGQIPSNIRQLQSLSFLSISNNSLTNIAYSITVLMNCKNLSAIILSKNFYGEAIPEAEDTLQPGVFQNLQVLGLGGCRFTGNIPLWLSKLTNLEVLDLSLNQITGSIPAWFGNLSNLFYLDLSLNLLSGELPKQVILLPELTSKRVEDTGSTLELPVFVVPDNVSYNNMQYNQLDSLPPAIYLQNNSLSGNIPIEIGQLKYINTLNLSCNNFNGSIPEQLSNLTNLEKLDLSGNNLSGEIPASLKILHFLSYFSVANNRLEGPIPTGGQFDTFSNSSFEGNAGLCGIILLRPCNNNSATTHPSASRTGPNKKLIIGIILGTCFVIGFALTVVALLILSKRKILSQDDPDKIDLDAVSFNSHSGIGTEVDKDTSLVVLFPNNTNVIKDISIAEILKATENFNQANIVGCGGFGLVYKATLPNGANLAVKKLSGDMGLMEREFKAEVEALSTAQHKNLVSLQGYCVHEGFRLLIYSYMENGSLDYWLHEKIDGASQLDWPARLKIARGASCGLAYMHQVCEPHIVHRDIKSSNILLDNKFEAHVADFGLSRLILPYHTHVTTELVGTLGYIPPEYGQAWVATFRGDMYSFGIVLLELLTGKRPVELFRPKVSRDLVVWVQQLRSEGKPEEAFDPLLRGKGFEEEMLQVLDMACMCVNRNPFKRPTINEVVDCLNDVGCHEQTPK